MGSLPDVGGRAFKDCTGSTPKGLALSLLWSRVSHELVLGFGEGVDALALDEGLEVPDADASDAGAESCDFLTG
jgi:hypothetical protein